jgi:hypothetical protein
MPFRQTKKRQRTAALQDASRFLGLLEQALRRGEISQGSSSVRRLQKAARIAAAQRGQIGFARD